MERGYGGIPDDRTFDDNFHDIINAVNALKEDYVVRKVETTEMERSEDFEGVSLLILG